MMDFTNAAQKVDTITLQSRLILKETMLPIFASLFAKHQWGEAGPTRTCLVCGCVEELTVGILTDDFYGALKRGDPMLHFQSKPDHLEEQVSKSASVMEAD